MSNKAGKFVFAVTTLLLVNVSQAEDVVPDYLPRSALVRNEITDLFEVKGAEQPYTGKVREYHENGTIKISGQLLEGKNIGLWYQRHSNGKLKSITDYHSDGATYYTDFHLDTGIVSSQGLEYPLPPSIGKKEMATIIRKKEIGFAENGQRIHLRTYNGKWQRHGTQISWYECGQRRSEGNYVNGMWDGEWKYWYESGNLRAKTIYEDDIVQSSQSFKENGELRAEGVYKNGKPWNGTFVIPVEPRALANDGFPVIDRIATFVDGKEVSSVKMR